MGTPEEPGDRGKKRKATFDTNENEIENEPPEKKTRVVAVHFEHVDREEVLPDSTEKILANIADESVHRTAKASSKPSKPTSFLDLPPELRIEIYRHRLIWTVPIRISKLKPYAYSHKIASLYDPLLSLLKEQAAILHPLRSTVKR